MLFSVLNAMINWPMVSIRRVLFLVCVVSIGFAPVRADVDAAHKNTLLEQLANPPKIAAASLSSYGHYVSALVRSDDGQSRVAVWRAFKPMETADFLPYTRPDVNWLAWVGEGRLLLSLKQYGLVLYDAHIGRLRPLIENGGPRPLELQPVLLSALPDDPSNILMQWEDPAVPGYPAVYRVNAITGSSEKIMGAWRPIIRWWAGPNGEVELGEGYRGRRQVLFARRAEGWAQITENDYFRESPISIVAVEAGGATAAVISGHAGDTRSLWRMETHDGTFLRQLASQDNFDIDAAIIDPVSNLVVGATYVEDGREQLIWQEDFRAVLSETAASLGLDDVELVSGSRDGRVALFRSRANWRPHRYFLMDEGREGLFEVAPDTAINMLPRPHKRGVWIKLKGRRTKNLGPMHALLSTPEAGANGKAVVLVHGGPVRRVSNTFSPLVSWLSANGYSVLQPNFRGSSGFGETWRRAGYARWGTDMQDDVRTAAEWMLESGYAEAGSMCVMGGSYGGYAALWSAIKDDDIFECAISLNGVTSVAHLVKYLDNLRFSLLSVPRIKGKLSKRTLRQRSPLSRADLVRLPVLLLHATRDANVPFDQGVQMAKSMRAYNKELEFIVLKGSEHQLRRTTDRRTYYEASLRFLEKYIGGGR